MGRSLHVLVVDDSAVVRQAATMILSRDPSVLVTVAADPYIAMDKMGRARPDVILLDLEMPRMDGLTFLRKIMREDPLPVVVCSSLARDGTEAAMRALEEGAVEVIAKPELGIQDFLHESADRLTAAVRAASEARPWRRGPAPRTEPAPADRPRGARPSGALRVTTDRVIALGASTGGTEALRLILEAMPPDSPGIAVVQHMPERFTTAFAQRLDKTCRIEVKEAEDGDRIVPGRALIAPGNRHLELRRDGAHYVAALHDGPPVSRHRPSVDVLFQSAAAAVGPNAVGAILTGMGDDGADGLVAMRRAGAHTLAQDERTSIVFGMPKEAIARGAVEEVLALPLIPAALLRAAGKTG
jgi:two-component system chemotaxis response regulator CheB